MKAKPREKFLPIATAVFGKEEEQEVIETMRSGWITLGPRTKQFEEDLASYIGSKHAVALNSASAALHLAMLSIGIKEGDEVITTPFTFAATANAILHCGGKPVFVDINPKTFNIDEDQIEKAVTSRTKAILPVHYGGQSVNLDKIHEIAKKHNLFVVEDAAHAISSEYKGKKIGTHSDLVCFSFHPVKNMTTGDGGAITTDNDELADKVRVLRVNGMDKESWKRSTSTGSWDYAITEEGYKYHMNDLSAALGIHQLKRLEGFRKVREEVADTYDKELADVAEITIPIRVSDIRHAHNIYGILIDTGNLKITRNEVIDELKKYNVGSIVYFRPLHLQPFFQKRLGLKAGDFPNAEFVFDRLICLPIYPGMTKEDAKYVSDLLKEIIEENRK
jgi:dTDP-4-amino-4,6-dideoxygalactose transaminase